MITYLNIHNDSPYKSWLCVSQVDSNKLISSAFYHLSFYKREMSSKC